jgi:lipoprotein
MRYRLFLLILLIGFWGCKEENDFGFILPDDGSFKVNFKEIAGGAVMYYTLPANLDVFAINARYEDHRGQSILKVGGYGSDSLILDGFNEASANIPVRISLVNNRNEESSPVNKTFSTLDSAPFAFFKGVTVEDSWDGFQVIYEAPEHVSGMLHVLYLGKDIDTQQPDTLLLKTYQITKGGDTLVLSLEQKQPSTTVILRTEDYKGYRVGQRVWEDVKMIEYEKSPLTKECFLDVKQLSVEDEYDMYGVEYLFDGDLKGERALQSKNEEAFTFLTKANAENQPFIIDLGKPQVPAKLRIYGALVGDFLRGYYYYNIWNSFYANKLPCKVTVYGGNSPDPDDASWTRIGKFEQDPQTITEDRWSAACLTEDLWSDPIYDLQELEKREAAYLEVAFLYSKTEYRYLKLVVNDVFDLYNSNYQEDYPNSSKYVTMHELEVYVKKN